jgi:hypothetical protein
MDLSRPNKMENYLKKIKKWKTTSKKKEDYLQTKKTNSKKSIKKIKNNLMEDDLKKNGEKMKT